MKYLLLLISLGALIALAGFNYYKKAHDSRAISTLHRIQFSLEQRSEQMLMFQSLVNRLYYDQTQVYDDLIEYAKFFSQYESVLLQRKDIQWEEWEGLPLLIENQERMVTLSANVISLSREVEKNEVKKMELIALIERLSILIKDSKQLSIKWSQYLSSTLSDGNYQIVTVNILVLCIVTIIWFYLYYNIHQVAIDQSAAMNKALEERQVKLLESKKVLVSIMEDMKHEKGQSNKLSLENQTLAEIVQRSSDGIFQVDNNGLIISANKSAKEMFKISDKLFGFESILDYVSRKDSVKIKSALEKCDRRNRVAKLEIQLNHDGTLHYLEMTISPLENSQSSQNCFSVVTHDISLRFLEKQQLKLIIEQAPNALIMINELGDMVMVNAQVESLFGYEADELLGKPIETLVPKRIAHKHPDLRNVFFEKPNVRSMDGGRDLTGLRKNETEVPVEIGLNPIKTSQGNFVIASIVDITERKKSHEKLEVMNKKLSLKNQELEQFIYSVSHDLKSPLVTIEGFAKKLSEELLELLSEKQLHRFERILSNVKYMEKLLADLLQLSKVIRKGFEKSDINYHSMIHSICESLESEISQSEAKINILSEPALIYANEGLFRQAMQNLISNAINYRNVNRPLIIDISHTTSKDGIDITVKDNGIGIHPKYHELVFRLFERLDVGDGTGVGLTIIKTIMDKHDGSVSLKSNAENGCEFTLHFPSNKNNIGEI